MKKNYVVEPFLINPPKRYRGLRRKNPIDLIIVNKPKFLTKRGEYKMKRIHSRGIRRHRSLLLNPMSGMGLDFSDNRKRGRRYHRNPAILSTIAPALDTSTVLPDIASGIVGFVAAKSIPTMVLPANWQTGVMKPVGQVVATLVVSYAASKALNRRIGKMVLYGGLLAVGTELIGGLLVKAGIPVSDVMGMGLYLSPQDLQYYMTAEETR